MLAFKLYGHKCIAYISMHTYCIVSLQYPINVNVFTDSDKKREKLHTEMTSTKQEQDYE